jgi:proline utilization trans-activator
MTSSLRFGTRIKDLSKGVPTDTSSPVDAYNLLEASADSPPLQWPTQERAYDLFETFLNSLSIVQHLLDPRAFSDRIATIFADGEVQRPIGSLWELEFVLVMAVGELREGAAATSDPLPGCAYFRQAIACLPQVGYLRTAGTIGIEIMGLIAFYLQCADCKEDAYIYVCPFFTTRDFY